MDSKKKLKKFYDQVGEKYPEEEEVYRTLRGRLRKKFILHWIKNQKGSLLEIGTNRGMYLEEYNGGARFGIDLSLPVLLKARYNRPVSYAVADAECLFCFKPDSFDNVLCSEVIEHCLAPQKIFESIAFVLKSGGFALLTTPNYKKMQPQWMDLGDLKNYGIDSQWNNKYYHSAFRPEELIKLARDVDLNVVESGTLEKEVKYIAKIPAAILLTGRFVNRIIKSQKFASWNEKFFQKLSIWIYFFCRITFVCRAANRLVKEGVRSYIIMQK